jgi:hypothetical protein
MPIEDYFPTFVIRASNWGALFTGAKTMSINVAAIVFVDFSAFLDAADIGSNFLFEKPPAEMKEELRRPIQGMPTICRTSLVQEDDISVESLDAIAITLKNGKFNPRSFLQCLDSLKRKGKGQALEILTRYLVASNVKDRGYLAILLSMCLHKVPENGSFRIIHHSPLNGEPPDSSQLPFFPIYFLRGVPLLLETEGYWEFGAVMDYDASLKYIYSNFDWCDREIEVPALSEKELEVAFDEFVSSSAFFYKSSSDTEGAFKLSVEEIKTRLRDQLTTFWTSDDYR